MPKGEHLKKYARNLTDEAKAGKLDPVRTDAPFLHGGGAMGGERGGDGALLLGLTDYVIGSRLILSGDWEG